MARTADWARLPEWAKQAPPLLRMVAHLFDAVLALTH
jgi:hypothetical protein